MFHKCARHLLVVGRHITGCVTILPNQLGLVTEQCRNFLQGQTSSVRVEEETENSKQVSWYNEA